jgi:hypothetical protein
MQVFSRQILVHSEVLQPKLVKFDAGFFAQLAQRRRDASFIVVPHTLRDIPVVAPGGVTQQQLAESPPYDDPTTYQTWHG